MCKKLHCMLLCCCSTFLTQTLSRLLSLSLIVFNCIIGDNIRQLSVVDGDEDGDDFDDNKGRDDDNVSDDNDSDSTNSTTKNISIALLVFGLSMLLLLICVIGRLANKGLTEEIDKFERGGEVVPVLGEDGDDDDEEKNENGGGEVESQTRNIPGPINSENNDALCLDLIETTPTPSNVSIASAQGEFKSEEKSDSDMNTADSEIVFVV